MWVCIVAVVLLLVCLFLILALEVEFCLLLVYCLRLIWVGFCGLVLFVLLIFVLFELRLIVSLFCSVICVNNVWLNLLVSC